MVTEIAKLTLFLSKDNSAYQSTSFARILGEIVRRTDPASRDFATFVQQEIWDPFGKEDLCLGIPDHVEHRIVRQINDGATAPVREGSYFEMSVPNAVRLAPEEFDRPDVRRACIAAATGCIVYQVLHQAPQKGHARSVCPVPGAHSAGLIRIRSLRSPIATTACCGPARPKTIR